VCGVSVTQQRMQASGKWNGPCAIMGGAVAANRSPDMRTVGVSPAGAPPPPSLPLGAVTSREFSRAAIREVCHKTKACPWFARGKCVRGDECNFAHSEGERRLWPAHAYQVLQQLQLQQQQLQNSMPRAKQQVRPRQRGRQNERSSSGCSVSVNQVGLKPPSPPSTPSPPGSVESIDCSLFGSSTHLPAPPPSPPSPLSPQAPRSVRGDSFLFSQPRNPQESGFLFPDIGLQEERDGGRGGEAAGMGSGDDLPDLLAARDFARRAAEELERRVAVATAAAAAGDSTASCGSSDILGEDPLFPGDFGSFDGGAFPAQQKLTPSFECLERTRLDSDVVVSMLKELTLSWCSDGNRDCAASTVQQESFSIAT